MMVTKLLDTVLKKLQSDEIPEGMSALFDGLRQVRLSSTYAQWTTLIHSTCLPHPLCALVHQEPVTWRLFHKPRGYAGDAESMDLIYFPERADLSKVSELGRQLFKYNTGDRPAAKACRHRLMLIANLVDETAERVNQPRILSVACGHFREVEFSQAARCGRLAEYVGIDQDQRSLQVAQACYARYGVRAVYGTVAQILAGDLPFKNFDFIYAAGLYDYLDQSLAHRLTGRLFEVINPGGSLLVANFRPAIADVGYMESYMGWHLIFRSETEIFDFLNELPHDQIAYTQLFNGAQDIISYLRIVKKQ